ncbi:mTERF family protein [Musa troglodytarum]|uniref:mTERF family protein n=1 Tax=Musa troglodytarum TaxID=320322 RepID=A0A9E7JXV8_9LILI|nr:mTERF family protein [Musa troglodytarum]
MTLMNRSPYFSLLSKALAFVPCCRPADAALFLATHSYSAASVAPQSSLMAEYLVSSCGFDPDEAAKASKLLGRIQSRHQPDSVLGLFRSYGFDNTQVKKVISANPRWLLLDVEKTLAPKFRALQDLGFSCSDITHLVRSNAVISHGSQTILSKIQLWQRLLGSNDSLVKLCKRNRWFLGHSIEKRIQPNIEILRDCGITDQKLSMILRYRPLLITLKAETLKALISRVEGLGVARTSGMFLLTLSMLQTISEKNFKAHMEFFKGFGWSEDDFLAAFRKAPTLVGFSLKSLQRKMEFLEPTKKKKKTMTLMNRSPYLSLLSKALAFVPCCRPADAALFLATHSYSAASDAPQSSLMAEYLVSSCGFDPDRAAKASKLLGRIESRHQPDSVLGLFRSYGFDNTQVKKVISENPRWLLLDVEKTLAPKLRALQDLGFSCSDITHLVRSNNHVISQKFQTILPKIQLWQDLLGSDDFLVKLCKRNWWFLGYSIEKRIRPNIEILRDCGITDQKLSMILRHRPRLITLKAEALKASISRVENLGTFLEKYVIRYEDSPELIELHDEHTKKKKKKKKKTMTLVNSSPDFSLLSKALAFLPCCRPADAAVFLATHSYSAASGAPQSSLMAEYLVSSCGFDPDQAAKASKLLGRIESRHQPDSVLGLFKSYGFDNTQIDGDEVKFKLNTLIYTAQNSLMAEYLVSSCGFDPDEAAKASKLLGRIESRHQPDSVLGFFKSQGFDNAQVKRVLSFNPRWLLVDVEKTLAPKFRALQDLGFSCSDIAYLVSSNNAVITHKLQNVLSKIQFWQGTLGSNDLLVKLCKSNRWFLRYSIEKKIQPNIQILRDFGITDQKLSMILRHHPLLIDQKAETLKALISRVENLGVARTSGMFPKTLKKFLEKFVIRHKEFPELIELYNVAPKNRTAL